MPLYLRSSFLYFACMIMVVVFAVLLYALLTFKKTDNKAEKNNQPNLKVELLWTIVPFIMIILMTLPAIKYFYKNNEAHKPVTILGVSHH